MALFRAAFTLIRPLCLVIISLLIQSPRPLPPKPFVVKGPLGGGLLVFCVADAVFWIQRNGEGTRPHGNAESALWQEMRVMHPGVRF